jgi:hypothetical protein
MQLLRRTHDHAVGTQDNFLVFVWRRHTPAVEVAHAGEALTELASRYPAGIQLMQVIEESAILPDAAARTAIAELLRDAAGKVLCSSVTHEGGGFRPSLIRSVVTGLLMLHKPAFPHLVFSSTDRALDKHAATLGVSPTDSLIRSVASAVTEVRAAIIEA